MTSGLAKITPQNNQIFAPLPSDRIATLIKERNEKRELIQTVASITSGDGFDSIIDYFTKGTRASSVLHLFDLDRALKSLDADYWGRALRLTDIYNIMPQDRRDAWDDQLTTGAAPEFVESIVVPTLEDLLAMRPQFLAERVDGIFRSLSREHVTNSPWGFGKRMILAGVTDKNSFTCHRQCGYINDLRAVIAKIMGRDQPKFGSTRFIISALARNTGEWHPVDGGALKLRVYKKGTCHIEVHEDMAWRLNAILSHLHPRAIPSENRTRPKRSSTAVEVIQDLIPFEVLKLLRDIRLDRGGERFYPSYTWSNADVHLRRKASHILSSIGGVEKRGRWEFNYPAGSVLDSIIAVGAVPEQKSHQYYPTPEQISRQVVDLADLHPRNSALEPSAGQGSIAQLMSKICETTCVEISSLHSEVLRSKGLQTKCTDFLKWEPQQTWDRIVMNPPFSSRRWRAHVEHAATLLSERGVLVAILPATSQKSGLLDGLSVQWHQPICGFPGVSIDLVIMRAQTP